MESPGASSTPSMAVASLLTLPVKGSPEVMPTEVTPGTGRSSGRSRSVEARPRSRPGEVCHGGDRAAERGGVPERERLGAEHGKQPEAEGAAAEPEPPAGDGKQDRLEHDLAGDVPAAGPEGLADGELLGAAAGADQEKVDEVDAADEEQKQHAALQQQEDRSDVAHMVLVQGTDQRMKPRADQQFGIGIVLDLPGVEGVDLRLGDREAGAGGEPGDELEVVRVAAGPRSGR